MRARRRLPFWIWRFLGADPESFKLATEAGELTGGFGYKNIGTGAIGSDTFGSALEIRCSCFVRLSENVDDLCSTAFQ